MGAMSGTATGLVSLLGLDPASYRSHALHDSGRTYVETNCYTDILIELLHARGDAAARGDGLHRADGLRG